MAGYDWRLIVDQGGEGFEEFIATCLVMRHKGAAQTRPAQGDSGVDVKLETDDGLVVWQVKRFTTRPSGSRWTNIKHSWQTFWDEVVTPGTKIAEYHLVTPWTPTDSALVPFNELTAEAPFPTDWLGEAFVNGLADENPWTRDRYLYGSAAAERFVTQKALVAASPIESSDDLTMLEAVARREKALRELRDTVSDHYVVNTGERSLIDPKALPTPIPGDASVFYRFESLGEGRWKYEAVVPRTADAGELDPISVTVTFLDPEDLVEGGKVRNWFDWGIPYEDAHAKTAQVGGPFGGETHEDTYLSIGEVADGPLPEFRLRVLNADETEKTVLPLRTLAASRGAHTGWVRFEMETLQGSLRFDLRLKPGDDITLNGDGGNVAGRDPVAVLEEVAQILDIASEGDTLEIASPNGLAIGFGNFQTYGAMREVIQPVAEGLVVLQGMTTAKLLMPNVREILNREFSLFQRYVSIYQGTPWIRTWEQIELTVPDDPERAEEMLARLRQMLDGSMRAVAIETPVVKLGGSEYPLEHALVTIRHSYASESEPPVDTLSAGSTVRVHPGDDDEVTTAMLADWKLGDDPINQVIGQSLPRPEGGDLVEGE